MSITEAYQAHTPGSAALAREAATLFPSGVTHDSRYMKPHGIYVARAAGAHKWDVDGNRYIDFYGGHGALILGHAHPAITQAAAEALASGTQFGANHATEIAWGRAIQALVPSAQRVRFTSSGTEATLMAIRLVRAFTGRSTILRFRGHYHGWHDHAASGVSSHFDGAASPGVTAETAARSLLLDPGDIAAVRAAIAASGDIAAVMLEPTGSSFGQVPLRPEFLHELRQLTEAEGVLLLFDEVVTGFRVSRGGAQAAFGVRPDLSCFAKIVAGGLPGAAVAGRSDIMDRLDFAAASQAGFDKLQHPGTFNANPVSAAAGVMMLSILANTDANDHADAMAVTLREGMNEALEQAGLPWAAYGTSSGFHLFMNLHGRSVTPTRFDPHAVPWDELRAADPAIAGAMRRALLINGMDTNGRLGGFTSAAHRPSDIAEAVAAFARALDLLIAEGVPVKA